VFPNFLNAEGGVFLNVTATQYVGV
jgi:hypothetical protein